MSKRYVCKDNETNLNEIVARLQPDTETILLGPREYTITPPLVIPDNVTLMGHDSGLSSIRMG